MSLSQGSSSGFMIVTSPVTLSTSLSYRPCGFGVPGDFVEVVHGNLGAFWVGSEFIFQVLSGLDFSDGRQVDAVGPVSLDPGKDILSAQPLCFRPLLIPRRAAGPRDRSPESFSSFLAQWNSFLCR